MIPVINTFYVHIENEKIATKFSDCEKASEFARRYDATVVKERGADIWYVVPKNYSGQISWIEEVK